MLKSALGVSEHRNTKKNWQISQYFNIEWNLDVIPKPLLCLLKFRANKSLIIIKNVFMKVRLNNLVIFDLDKINNIHWCVG